MSLESKKEMRCDQRQQRDLIAINWGSTNFRAYRITPAGETIGEWATPDGVGKLDRDGMVRTLTECLATLGSEADVIASGMIGSDIGWQAAGYIDCPADVTKIATDLLRINIADVPVSIVPGLACSRADGSPDVLRGEEIELLGAAAAPEDKDANEARVIVLPGTHTKWVRLVGTRVVEFFTSMSGEIFDRLTSAGLLASVIAGEAQSNDAFRSGVDRGKNSNLALGTLLFEVRAAVLRQKLERDHAASYLRGVLIGAELGDARRIMPDMSRGRIRIVGNAALSRLYSAALADEGFDPELLSAKDATIVGFRRLHAAIEGL